MKNTGTDISRLLLAAALLIMVQACAVNPVTNKRELMLVSQNKEFEIGQGVDKEVREEMGIYLEKPELRNLLKEMVENIGRKSHRPDVIYRAEIVDTSDFNAFAVPGGFVYAHRGLLERMNSADELASVMGHEIAHVSARHSASQISKQQLVNLVLQGASIATGGEIKKFGDVINIGSALAFNKFSRDDERQADYLGIRYMTDAGYNPEGAIHAMETIKSINEKEPGLLETWFMTHPPTSERIDNLNKELNELSAKNPEILKRKKKRNEYIMLLEGMAVGEWNGSELVKGDRYYNREFMLSIPVLSGWTAHINNKNYTAVFTNSKDKAYAVFNIEPLSKKVSTEEYFKGISSKIKSKNLKPDGPENSIISHGAVSGSFTGVSGNSTVYACLTSFVKEYNGYSILEVSENSLSSPSASAGMINNLVFLPEKEIAEIKPLRMRIHRVKKNETWKSITKIYYSGSDNFTKLAEYNGFRSGERPEEGMLLKIPPTLRFD